jgi:hypothetical protein
VIRARPIAKSIALLGCGLALALSKEKSTKSSPRLLDFKISWRIKNFDKRKKKLSRKEEREACLISVKRAAKASS